jgi:hypothetical protein
MLHQVHHFPYQIIRAFKPYSSPTFGLKSGVINLAVPDCISIADSLKLQDTLLCSERDLKTVSAAEVVSAAILDVRSKLREICVLKVAGNKSHFVDIICIEVSYAGESWTIKYSTRIGSFRWILEIAGEKWIGPFHCPLLQVNIHCYRASLILMVLFSL